MNIETKFNLGDEVYFWGEFARGNIQPHKITKIIINVINTLGTHISYELDGNNSNESIPEFELYDFEYTKKMSLEWHKERIKEIKEAK